MTLPAWIDIVRDIEELAPNTTILNYTNPMSAVTLATTRITDIPIVGSVPFGAGNQPETRGNARGPYEELKWECWGLTTWLGSLLWSTTARICIQYFREKAKDPEFLALDPVRLDAMLYLGAFVTESSGHFSEYIPYYRKRQDLIDKHCSVGYNGATGFYANEWPTWRANTDREIQALISGEKELNLEKSHEYAAVIIEAMVKNVPNVIYGNVKNTGLIENLPQDGIVEVACMINRNRINPCYYGRLPEHLAALNRSNMAFFELAVEAVLQKDREMAMRALMMDPLTAAVCSLTKSRRCSMSSMKRKRSISLS